MCTFGPENEGEWEPVVFRRDLRPPETRSVRVLCGAYEVASPFIEGGCATDWIEDLSGPDFPMECPRCGQACPEEVVAGVREALATRTVFVVGCVHRAFTFSRRDREPYFDVDEDER